MPIEIKELKISFHVKDEKPTPSKEVSGKELPINKIVQEVTERVLSALERKRDER